MCIFIEGNLLLEIIIFCVFFITHHRFLFETIPLQALSTTTTRVGGVEYSIEGYCILGLVENRVVQEPKFVKYNIQNSNKFDEIRILFGGSPIVAITGPFRLQQHPLNYLRKV